MFLGSFLVETHFFYVILTGLGYVKFTFLRLNSNIKYSKMYTPIVVNIFSSLKTPLQLVIRLPTMQKNLFFKNFVLKKLVSQY